MRIRPLGSTGRQVSEIGFGTWQIGSDWGDVEEDAAMATLHAAADAGVTFFDTADVYGDGRSERLLGRLLREREGEAITVATKMGRRLDQTVENYSPEHFRAWNDRSRENLGVETLDLVQLHCPPTDLYYHPEVFEVLEAMVGEGRIAAYGVSVERVEEALKAIEYPGVKTVQIIFNAFRQRPAGVFFEQAVKRGRPASCRASTRATRSSAPTTTAASTATARRSTSARRSRACRSRSASTLWRSCARSCPRARRWPSSRCAGS